MRLRHPAHLLALSVSLLAGCGGGGSKPPALAPVGTKGWTVLVYMTADNNLEGDGLKDLAEMASIDSGADLRFVVQVDRAVGQAAGPVLNLPDFTSAKRFVVRRGQVQDPVDLGEVNMGLSSTLSDFITWGLKTYPGERYMLVFWDHGGGWKGFGWDDSAPLPSGEPDHLSLDRIATGVHDGLAGTTVPKFDTIGFDACLMATVEVAESLKPYASYLIASEETEPGHGWDWAAFGGGGLLAPVDLGKKVIDGFYAQATAQTTVAQVTLSLVDLSKLGPIEVALASLAGAYPDAGAVAPVLGAVATGRQKAVEFASNPDPRQAYALVDAADLASGMSGVTGAAALQTAISAAVVYERHGAAKAGSNGLSIYFPPDSAYYDARYDALPGMGTWRTFLNAVYGGGAAQVVPAWATTSASANGTGLTVSGTLSPGSASAVSKAYLQYGLETTATAGGPPFSAILLGDQPADVAGVGVTSTWDWSLPVLYQGTYQEVGYLSVEQTGSSAFTASFPLAYQATSAAVYEFAVWQVALDGTTGAVLSSVVYLYSAGGVAQLSAAAGSKLRALVMVMPDMALWTTSWELSSAAGAGFDATKPLAIQLLTAPGGFKGAAILRAENSAGEGAWIYAYGNPRP